MTEEEVKPIKEKEEKRKIKVISEIDDLLAIQGQYYIKGQLKDALGLADKITELAETESLESFIREQEQLIARIKGILKKREEEKRGKFINQLKTELTKLETKFNNAFKAEDFITVEQIINDAKKPLFELSDENITLKWREFENKYIDAKARKEIIEEVLKLIKERSDLITNFQFEDFRLRLTYLKKQVQDKDIKDYGEKLRDMEKELIVAEESYNNIQEKIKGISEKISIQRKSKEFKSAIKNSEDLLELATSINRKGIVEEYSSILSDLKADLEFEELKEFIKKLNDQGLNSLKIGEIQTSIEKFKKIQDTIKKYI
ncbi:MAG: hypothetical protein ACFFFT_15985 [Candidatus Thorarchaeota archaeon]